jgi:hypothetical protein
VGVKVAKIFFIRTVWAESKLPSEQANETKIKLIMNITIGVGL